MTAPEFAGLALRPMPPGLRLALLAGLAAMGLALIYYGLISNAPLPDYWLIVGWNDLLLHLAGFGGFSLVAFALLSPIIRVALGVMGLGVAMELAQAFTSGHEPSFEDALANGVGIALAAVAFLVMQWAVSRERKAI